MWHTKISTDFDISEKRAKLACKSSGNFQQKKNRKFSKNDNFLKIFAKNVTYS